jgi:hypothetical protein
MYKQECNKMETSSGVKAYLWERKKDDGSQAFARIRDCGPYRFLITMVSPPNIAQQEAVDLLSEFVRELHPSICSDGGSWSDDSILGVAVLDVMRSWGNHGRIVGHIALRDYSELPREDQKATDDVEFYIDAIGHEYEGSPVASSKKLNLLKVRCPNGIGMGDAADTMHRAAWEQPWETFDSVENHVYEVTPVGLKY